VAADRYSKVEAWLRSLSSSQQRDLAITLASLIEPFASVSDQGQPVRGLAEVARMVRDADDIVEVDHARHLLFSTPELALKEEPEGRAWFALGATVAWIYAADSKATAPSDGVVSAFSRVLDELDYADEALGDTMMTNHLLDWLGHRMRGNGASLAALELEIRRAVQRLCGET
jgi:hypothetical protein